MKGTDPMKHEPSTLRELLAARPEWADLPVAVATVDGGLDYIDGAALVFKSHDDAEDCDVLVFAPN
jgi:hypothetical protein